jgi:hypothetical protein
MREGRAQRTDLALDHGHTLDQPVNIRERPRERLQRRLHAGRGPGGHAAHLAGGGGNPAVAFHRQRRGFTQGSAYLRLPLHASRDFFDVPRHVADFDSQFARLRGNVADDRTRPAHPAAHPAKAEARH